MLFLSEKTSFRLDLQVLQVFWLNFLEFSELKRIDHIWESYSQKITQKQPAMVVFADTKIFENS